jgi:hypothetical protein
MVHVSRTRRHEVTWQGNREGNRGQRGVFPSLELSRADLIRANRPSRFSTARCK